MSRYPLSRDSVESDWLRNQRLRGEVAETSMLDRILSAIPGSSPSSVPPTSDMSTRTDYQAIPSLAPEPNGQLNFNTQDAARLGYESAPVTGGLLAFEEGGQMMSEGRQQGDLSGLGNYLSGLALQAAAIPEILSVGKIKSGTAARVLTKAVKEAGKTVTKQAAIINQGIRNEPTLEKAIKKARRQKHLISDQSKGAEGQFIGAPRGMNSRSQIRKMRKEFDAQVAGGVLGADWYQRVKNMISDVSGGDKKKENKLSEAFALFSAQANPDTNMGWAIQARNQWAAGQRGEDFTRVKTGRQSDTFQQFADTDEQTKLGKKTQVYHDSLNPNVGQTITGTNDIWHGRAFGYRNNDGTPFSRGFTPQEHVFLDNETVLAVDRANKRKLGGRDNWTAAEIQAAAWVFAKGKSEFAKNPGKFNDNFNNAIDWAKKTYPDYLQKYTAYGTREDIPGAGTGQLPALLNTDYMTRAEYSDDVPGSYATPQDVITDASGLYGEGLRPATGVFTSKTTGVTEVNPAQANQVLVDLVNDEGGKTISNVSQSFLNAIEGVQGYINMQNGSAWHKFMPFQKNGGVKSKVSNALRIETGAPLDEARMKALANWADERGMILSDNGASVVLWPDEWGKKPALTSGGKEMIAAGNVPSGTEMQKLLNGVTATKTREAVPGWQDELVDLLQVDKAKIQRGRVVSGYVDYENITKRGDLSPEQVAEEFRMPGKYTISDSAAPNAGRSLRTKTVLDLLDDPNIPAMLENLDNSREFKQLVIDNINRANDWAKRLNTPLREDHMNALKILSQKGFKGLREAMKNGAVLPAVALPIFGSAFQLQQEQQG